MSYEGFIASWKIFLDSTAVDWSTDHVDHDVQGQIMSVGSPK